MRHLFLATLVGLAAIGCGGGAGPDEPKTPYQAFLRDYAKEVRPAWEQWRTAEWRAHTYVVAGDHVRAAQAQAAFEQWRNVASDPKWVRLSRDLARQPEGAPPATEVEKAAMEAVGRMARKYPATDRDLLARIDEAVGLQARFRRRAQPKLDGEPVRPDEIARQYATAIDTTERKRLWKSILSPSADLKPGYAQLRDLRNDLARKGGWSNHMDREFDIYGMTSVEMADLMVDLELELRPLYQELHTWAREELAVRYDVATPDLIPAHWLPAPHGQDWSGLVVVEHLDPEPALQEMGAKQMIRQVEDWYVSTGLTGLPGTFWERSSLYPPAPGERVGKTQGASTWWIDLRTDIRVLMNARPTAAWLSAAHREFGFAHGALARHEAKLPIAVKTQSPRALQGALGLWADLAATRPARMKAAGLVSETPDPALTLLAEALTFVPFVQFGAGTVVPFEYEIYAENLAPGQMNSRWWGLLARHQGVFPPETRTERWADFLYVDALTDAPGRYVDHVLSVVLAFQLHDALCRELGVDPRKTDLTGTERFGEMFEQLATGEGVREWRSLVQATTGEPPSASGMVRYFEPLMGWLKQQNAARPPTLPPIK